MNSRRVKDLGKITKRKVLESMQKVAEIAGVSPQEILDLHLVYFQSGAGSYTKNAGGERRLDHLFEFTPEEKRMSFTKSVVEKITEIKENLRRSPSI